MMILAYRSSTWIEHRRVYISLGYQDLLLLLLEPCRSKVQNSQLLACSNATIKVVRIIHTHITAKFPFRLLSLSKLAIIL